MFLTVLFTAYHNRFVRQRLPARQPVTTQLWIHGRNSGIKFAGVGSGAEGYRARIWGKTWGEAKPQQTPPPESLASFHMTVPHLL